jgi:basic membrane protein A
MQMALGIPDSKVVRKLNVDDGDAAAIRIAVEDCIAQGCKIVFGTSFGYQETMQSLATEYPNVIFSHGTGYLNNNVNMNNYFGRIYQARYLAGIAAGLKTKTNKIGYVAAYGTDLAETCSGINAFALGAMAANPEAKVYVKELNSWYDPANETAYAEALIELGCDVITQHCDTPNPQKAAQAAGVWGCGYNSDMTKDAPKAHLVAAIWNWEVYYTTAVSAALQGAEYFMNSVTKDWYGGLKDGFVDVSPSTLNCAPGTKSAINKVKALMVTWENEYEANDEAGPEEFTGFDVFGGYKLNITITDGIASVEKVAAALKDNENNTIVAAGGAYVGNGVIKGSMNYFVAGVESK